MDLNKDEFYRQLESLRESSDDEDQNDADELRELLRKNVLLKPLSPVSSSFPSFLPSPARQTPETRRNQSQARSTTPGIMRTTSAPVSSVSFVKETPHFQRKSSLLRFDISNPAAIPGLPTVDASVIKETPFSRQRGSSLRFDISTPVAASEPSTIDASVIKETPPAVEKSQPHRSVSTPVIGSVVMKYSLGIKDMIKKAPLSKKRKRMSKEIKLVVEEHRIFLGQTFFYVPNDNIAKLRRARIDKAIEYGATWSTEWTMEITHVFVENKFTYGEVMAYLAPIIRADSLPSSIILVNENYPLHCVQFKRLLDPKQDQYMILPPKAEPSPVHEEETDPQSNVSLQIKASRPCKVVEIPEEQTPPRSQPSTENIDKEVEKLSRMDTTHVFTKYVEQQDNVPLHDRGDALDDMINSVKASLRDIDLPLDYDDSGILSSSEDEEEGGSTDEEDALRAKDEKKAKPEFNGTKQLNQDGFICMKGGTGITLDSNPNKHIIAKLEEMAKHYTLIKDPWRPKAYRTAVGVLKKQTKKISTFEEAIAFRGIGPSVADKIQEIARTNGLVKLDNIKLDQSSQTLKMFNQIYGVGLSLASRWVQAGYKTLDDLKAHVSLTRNQLVGIEHYEDFQTSIPRDEVTALGEIVKIAAANIDREVSMMIMGSYRRGVDTSGDIDMLITRAGSTSSQDLLPFLLTLVEVLTKQGFLVAALAVPRHDAGSKWHGACKLSKASPIWRRIDLLLVPETELGAAMIYFTGDDIFNRSIRLLASRFGMRLNQKGLFKDVMRGANRVKLNEGTLLEGANEMKIFELLGVPWRAPEMRICREANEIES